MNKKGFISTTVVYTFFFVFLMMLLFIIVKYSSNRNLLKTLKEDIKTSLQDDVLIGDICNNQIMSRCFTTYYDHDANLSFHGTIGANDESYRYNGANPNNYICFGSIEDTCPSDALYRIIGLFKNSSGEYQVKLIKASILDNTIIDSDETCQDNLCYWNNNDLNSWQNSTLNIINLNTSYMNYLTSIDSKWPMKIVLNNWIVGGINPSNLTSSNASSIYNYEIMSPATSDNYQNSIGLMYISDYMYAASETFWDTLASNYASASGSNWLYLGASEWTITRATSGNNAFYINSNGNVSSDSVRTAKAIRPVLFLSVTTKMIKGHGTITDPYRIEV